MPSSTRCLSTFFHSCSLRRHLHLSRTLAEQQQQQQQQPPRRHLDLAKDLFEHELPHITDRPSTSEIVVRRVLSLPRSRLQPSSKAERDLLDDIQHAPTRKNARVDVFRVLRQSYESARQRRKAISGRWAKMRHRGQTHWLPHARKLEMLTGSRSPPPCQRTLDYDEPFIDFYFGRAKSNLCLLRGYGVTEIEIFPPDPQTKGRRKLVLSGTQDSVQYAIGFLDTQARQLAETGEIGRAFSLKKKGMKIQISNPSTFTWRVNRLIDLALPVQAQRDTSISRHLYTTDKLLQLFNHQTVSKHANLYALRRALRYICRFDDLYPLADKLMRSAKALGLRCDTTTYNTILRQSLLLNLEDRVATLLDDMATNHVPANIQTWFIFLTAMDTRSERAAVLEMINESGLKAEPYQLDVLLGTVLAQMIKTGMPDSKESLEEAIRKLTELFGSGWLGSTGYEKMVHAVIKRQQYSLRELPRALIALPKNLKMTIDRRVQLAQFQLYRHQNLSTVLLPHLHVILQAKVGNGHSIRWFVAYAFMTAWNCRHLNVCRVLWMHAASYGNIYRSMLALVSKSLRSNVIVTNRSADWWRHAGSLICGTDLDTTGFQETFPKLSSYCSSLSSVREWACCWTPDDGTRDEQLSLIYVLLHRDLNAWKRVQGMRHAEFDELLTEAYEKDCDPDLSWAKSVPYSVREQSVIEVPLRETKDQGLSSTVPQQNPRRRSFHVSERALQVPKSPIAALSLTRAIKTGGSDRHEPNVQQAM
jgi:hypothetical protein